MDAEPVNLNAKPVVLSAEPVILSAEPVILSAKPVVLSAEPVVLSAKPVILNAVKDLEIRDAGILRCAQDDKQGAMGVLRMTSKAPCVS